MLPAATLHMYVDGDSVFCERLEIEPRSTDEPLTAQGLRAIPFGRMVQRAPVRATRSITFDPADWGRPRAEIEVRPLSPDVSQAPAWLLEDPAKSTRGRLADKWQDMSSEELAEAVHQLQEQPLRPQGAHERRARSCRGCHEPPRRGRQPLSDEELREVARDYRTFVKLGQRDPTIQVALKHHGSRSTASRWIRRARELGFLEPATKQGDKQ